MSFTGIATARKEICIDILRHLKDAVRTKRPEEQRSVGFSFTTMLQHTDWFLSRISYQRTKWKHWSIPHNLLTCLHLIFICTLDWNQHRRDGTFAMLLLTSLRMRRKSWKGFHKRLLGMFQTPSHSLAETYICTRGLFGRKHRLNDCTLFAFIRNKVTPGTFWSYRVLHFQGNVFVQAHILPREGKIFLFSSLTHCLSFIRNR